MGGMAACVAELEAAGDLRRVDFPVNPDQELGCIQRRAFRSRAPALLFTRVAGCRFPVAANIFGTRARLGRIFRRGLKRLPDLLRLAARPERAFASPLKSLFLAPALLDMWPRMIRASRAPSLQKLCRLEDLPQLKFWPLDGGPFITLPVVQSRMPGKRGRLADNLGMYRVQQAGNEYAPGELGLHYQIHRGIGAHHAAALERGEALPVNIHVGGPPALAVAAVMPLPEGVPELAFAGLLAGGRMRVSPVAGSPLPALADADFCISGHVLPMQKPEGPFGDHMGYYSLKHDFPVLAVDCVRHRPDAVWPFTSVGRPPQEDTVFGDFIHELVGPLLGTVFPGLMEVHAVDAAGVHPLLLAIGSERYTAYEARRKPRELLTEALHLLGVSQTALAKFLLIAAHEDAPGLGARDVPAFLAHMLERSDFERDLHFISRCNNDTLDYSGGALHEGSKLIWAAAGEKRRELGREMPALPDLPAGFGPAAMAMPGLLLIGGPRHNLEAGVQDRRLEDLAARLGAWPLAGAWPLVVVVDDPAFCAESLDNFLWVCFTRADPATDSYGAGSGVRCKHWGCRPPLILDSRLKPFHAPPLEEDPEVVRRVEALAGPHGPLRGLF